MKHLATCFVWWPGLDAAIETKIGLCEMCQTIYSLPPKAPLHPCSRRESDYILIMLVHTQDTHFLFIVDAQFKWIDSHIVNSISSEATIEFLCKLLQPIAF